MKPRRDITLGEMQDECRKRAVCRTSAGEGTCKYFDVCSYHSDRAPRNIDLTDPPRFNEQQMALLKALWDIGVVKLERFNEYDDKYYAERKNDSTQSLICCDWLGETVWKIDLAELFGKEGTK